MQQVLAQFHSGSQHTTSANLTYNNHLYSGAVSSPLSPPWGQASALPKTPAPARNTIIVPKAFEIVRRCLRRIEKPKQDIHLDNIATLAREAKRNGQTALHEELSRRLVVAKEELKLMEAGFDSYLPEKTVFSIQSRSAGKLRITPIENFGRVIPAEASERLQAAKNSGFFSAFSVFHAGEAFIKTTAQLIQEKDPILFGLIKNQPGRLYFIADWMDELCDMTLDKLLRKEGILSDLKYARGDVSTAEIQEMAANAETRKQLLAETAPATWRKKLSEALSL